mgnify:CR=1 FL=1
MKIGHMGMSSMALVRSGSRRKETQYTRLFSLLVQESAVLVSLLKLSREKQRIETSTTKTLITLHLVFAHNPFRNVLAEYGNTHRAFSSNIFRLLHG